MKHGMGEVIEMSTLAYSARDEAQTKMLALKEKADKELAQYNMELKVNKFNCAQCVHVHTSCSCNGSMIVCV